MGNRFHTLLVPVLLALAACSSPTPTEPAPTPEATATPEAIDSGETPLLIMSSGTDLQLFHTDGTDETTLDWSADGMVTGLAARPGSTATAGQVLVTRRGGGSDWLDLVAWDGTTTTTLWSANQPTGLPAWGPAGDWFLYIIGRDESFHRVFVDTTTGQTETIMLPEELPAADYRLESIRYHDNGSWMVLLGDATSLQGTLTVSGDNPGDLAATIGPPLPGSELVDGGWDEPATAFDDLWLMHADLHGEQVRAWLANPDPQWENISGGMFVDGPDAASIWFDISGNWRVTGGVQKGTPVVAIATWDNLDTDFATLFGPTHASWLRPAATR